MKKKEGTHKQHKMNKIGRNKKNQLKQKIKYLPPINIMMTQKIFSYDVFAETLPKPTDVKLLNVKYRAVI